MHNLNLITRKHRQIKTDRTYLYKIPGQCYLEMSSSQTKYTKKYSQISETEEK